MSEEQPHWYISRQPNTNWNEADAARFDGVPLEPPQDKRIFNRRQPDGTFRPLSEYFTPPLDPQQSMLTVCCVCGQTTDNPHIDRNGEARCSVCENEQIADAARLAADDIALVFRIWPYGSLSPLPELRALLGLLAPPAPTWTQEDE